MMSGTVLYLGSKTYEPFCAATVVDTMGVGFQVLNSPDNIDFKEIICVLAGCSSDESLPEFLIRLLPPWLPLMVISDDAADYLGFMDRFPYRTAEYFPWNLKDSLDRRLQCHLSLWHERNRASVRKSRSREVEDLFKKLFENLKSGAIIFSAFNRGDDFVVQNVNRMAEQLLGKDRQSLLKGRLLQLFPELKNGDFFESLKKVYYSGENTEQKGLFYKGKSISGWRDCLFVRLSAEEIVVLFEDSSELVLAKERLQESESRFRSIFEHARDMLLLVDPETGKIIEANQRAVDFYGFPREQLYHMGVFGLNILSREEVLQRMSRVQKSGFQLYRFIHQKVDDSRVDVEVYSIPINIDGKQYLLSHISDQTEKKRIEKLLYRSERMNSIGTLASGIAHDFNNIIYIILGYAEMAKFKYPDDNRIQEYMDGILKAISRARSLVSQILTFSKEKPGEMKSIKLSDAIQETIQFLKASLPSNVALKCHVDEGEATVLADTAEIHRLLLNLCTNAASSMPNGGSFSISLAPVENCGLCLRPEMRLVVEDTGKGIAQEILDRVFDPYFTTKKMGEGTGLGLSIVHGIVKRHQGHIEIDSLPEKGTKILVSFPQCSLPEESFTFGDVEHSYRGNGESILFVDDELQIVDLQYEMLQELGYQVKAVSDSKQALQCFEESPDEFDLLITDMMMPKMTGAELARAVLEIRPGLPVIVCTGFSDQISAEKARQLGIQGFLLKPVINQDLAKKIYEILHPE